MVESGPGPQESEINSLKKAELPSETTKKEIVERGFSEKGAPDSIFVFSGGITDRNGVYRTTTFTDVIEQGVVTGSRTRVIAAEKIAKLYAEVPVVATSKVYPNEPTHSSVIAEELIDRGIDSKRIVYEEQSYSTITQLIEMIKLASKNKWKRIAAITNSYQLERMNELFMRLEEVVEDQDFQKTFKDFLAEGSEVSFIPAEDILAEMGPKFKEYLRKASLLPGYQALVESEKNGVEALRAGEYRFKQPKA